MTADGGRYGESPLLEIDPNRDDAGTGIPFSFAFSFAGENLYWFTASIAFTSKPLPAERTTCGRDGKPSSVTTI